MAAVIIAFPDRIIDRPHNPDAWRGKPQHLLTDEDRVEMKRDHVHRLKKSAVDPDKTFYERLAAEAMAMAFEEDLEEFQATVAKKRTAIAKGSVLIHKGIAYPDAAGAA